MARITWDKVEKKRGYVVHKLNAWLESDELCFDVEHHESCLRHEVYRGEDHLGTEWRCEVQNEMDNGAFDPPEKPGTYYLIAWFDRYYNYEYGWEADGGLEVWSEAEMRPNEYDVTSDGTTVWVCDSRGNTTGRFGVLGIDIHSSDPNSATECLLCTHERTTVEDWHTFVEKMALYHGVKIEPDHMPRRFADGEAHIRGAG